MAAKNSSVEKGRLRTQSISSMKTTNDGFTAENAEGAEEDAKGGVRRDTPEVSHWFLSSSLAFSATSALSAVRAPVVGRRTSSHGRTTSRSARIQRCRGA